MRRKNNSARSLKWIYRNSLNNNSCCEYVKELCQYSFGFEEFEIIKKKNLEPVLQIPYNGKRFEIEVNTEDICLNIYDISDKVQIKLKTIFTGDNCWFSCFDWIKKNIL